MKWFSLAFLVIQNASTILLMRYIRTIKGDLFFSTTAIVCQEFLKIILSILFLYFESKNIQDAYMQIDQHIFKNLADTLKTGVPAFLYTIQNNLIYVSVSHLDAAVFQVTFQLKILTTAFFMVLILNRRLLATQWLAMFILFIGVAIIQIQNVNFSNHDDDTNKGAIFGFICVLVACFLSGLAGVFYEKILKNSPVSLWIRNIQLGSLSTIIALFGVWINDGDAVAEKGFFFGYNNLVWINVFIQSIGGLLVGIVVKYADNILKGFATSIAIVVSCVASVYLFETKINVFFAIGTLLVVSSTLIYSYVPPRKNTEEDAKVEFLVQPK